MRGAGVAGLQILGAAVAVAVVSGLIGLIISFFVGSGGALNGFAWGMVAGGALVGLLAGGSGSPSENLARGRTGAFGTYWSQSAALPESPLQLALGAVLAFAAGVAVLILSYQ
jgi:hypothetical protein